MGGIQIPWPARTVMGGVYVVVRSVEDIGTRGVGIVDGHDWCQVTTSSSQVPLWLITVTKVLVVVFNGW